MSNDQNFYLALAGMFLTALTTMVATIWGARNAQQARANSAATLATSQENKASIAEVRVIVNGSREKLIADLLAVTTQAAHAHGIIQARAEEDSRTAQVAQTLATAAQVALTGAAAPTPVAPVAPPPTAPSPSSS